MRRPQHTFAFLLGLSSVPLSCARNPAADELSPTLSSSGGSQSPDQSASGGSASTSGGSDGGSSPGVGGRLAQGSGGMEGLPSGGSMASVSGGAGGSNDGTGGSALDSCARPGVLLCDDFETASAGQAPSPPWALAVNGLDGTVVVDGISSAHSGTQSVKVDSQGNYQTFFAVSGAPVFTADHPALYLRVYLRLDAPMTGGHNTYFKAGAADAISSDNETRVGVMNEMLMINQPDGDRGFLSNEDYWTDSLPGVVLVEKTWNCIEGFFDPPHSTVSFWVEGEEVPDLHITDWKQDTLGSFQFGFEKYAGPDAVIWYDDIVISTEPIGCE